MSADDKPQHNDPVVVHVCESAEEGLVLGALLEADKIPYQLLEDPGSLGAGLTGNFGVPAEGRVLVVPRQYLDLAKQIIEEHHGKKS